MSALKDQGAVLALFDVSAPLEELQKTAQGEEVVYCRALQSYNLTPAFQTLLKSMVLSMLSSPTPATFTKEHSRSHRRQISKDSST